MRILDTSIKEPPAGVTIPDGYKFIGILDQGTSVMIRGPRGLYHTFKPGKPETITRLDTMIALNLIDRADGATIRIREDGMFTNRDNISGSPVLPFMSREQIQIYEELVDERTQQNPSRARGVDLH